MPNTNVTYMYRDEDNWKSYAEVVVEGDVSFEDIADYLDDATYFCPADVSLGHPGLSQSNFSYPEADHCWCELDVEDFEDTEVAPTEGLTAENFIAAFKEASERGWPSQFGIDSYV